MLLSILMNDQGLPLAGGMACDQIPLGDVYWVEVLGLPSTMLRGCETAVIEIDDEEMAQRLLNRHLELRGVAIESCEFASLGLQSESQSELPGPRRAAA